MFRIILCFVLVTSIPVQTLFGDGPEDNSVENVRPVPPLGIEIPAEQRTALETRLASLSQTIDELKLPKYAATQQFIPDVLVLHRAVAQAVTYQEMFQERDLKTAEELLNLAEERANHLKNGQAPWTTQHGFVVRGFLSELDGTVQPYGLEIANDYNFEHPTPVRCDLWFHGRGERSMELHFISQRLRSKGPYPPTTGIVLHPYGRYSNAFKFAGEVDSLEALQHVQRNYQIDPNRIAVRGFSMGGAGCWQFAVHYADRWFAANPGAGFSETPRFLKSFQGETLNPPWYEEKLWRMYDCDLWAENLRQLPTVAYSGEIDRQKQAADVMEVALKDQNIQLMHIIGPQTAHAIHPESNQLIRQKMEDLSERGRERFPRLIDFTTFTLKYNRLHWLTVHGLRQHWERSTIQARVEGDHSLWIESDGITEFSVDYPAGSAPFDVQNDVNVTINGQTLPTAKANSDLSFSAHYHLANTQWRTGPSPQDDKYRKRHNLQGPVDDALMLPFLFVKPTGETTQPQVKAWVEQEMTRAIREWRRHMRGDARIKNDRDVTEEDLANFNLILWGTPESNSLLAKISAELPIQWSHEEIQVGSKTFSSQNHAPILIHPNPLNPQRYIVLNSSFTYREYDYLNNARQTPKLPDWAIINLETPPNSRWPGAVIEAGFFNEHWELPQP